jgi:hypothetical protein
VVVTGTRQRPDRRRRHANIVVGNSQPKGIVIAALCAICAICAIRLSICLIRFHPILSQRVNRSALKEQLREVFPRKGHQRRRLLGGGCREYHTRAVLYPRHRALANHALGFHNPDLPLTTGLLTRPPLLARAAWHPTAQDRQRLLI